MVGFPHHPSRAGDAPSASDQLRAKTSYLLLQPEGLGQQVNLFASSLKHKRLGEIRKLLPLTYKVLGKEFDSLFVKYFETYLPTGSKKNLQDAVAFSNFIEEYLSKDNAYHSWLLDVLHYEKARLKMSEGKRSFICDRAKPGTA